LPENKSDWEAAYRRFLEIVNKKEKAKEIAQQYQPSI